MSHAEVTLEPPKLLTRVKVPVLSENTWVICPSSSFKSIVLTRSGNKPSCSGASLVETRSFDGPHLYHTHLAARGIGEVLIQVAAFAIPLQEQLLACSCDLHAYIQ